MAKDIDNSIKLLRAAYRAFHTIMRSLPDEDKFDEDDEISEETRQLIDAHDSLSVALDDFDEIIAKIIKVNTTEKASDVPQQIAVAMAERYCEFRGIAEEYAFLKEDEKYQKALGSIKEASIAVDCGLSWAVIFRNGEQWNKQL